eukprot:TRINITY_DN72352_c0_g1_i1.p1 TRINITY_DN72352_c0_g1~~TRINITY_DN72352_c0_g1_i1.p1  ORF type:complete len:180 (+),score=30.09 TRINITY_DN72352_c0_g1_i1:457-996(+)
MQEELHSYALILCLGYDLSTWRDVASMYDMYSMLFAQAMAEAALKPETKSLFLGVAVSEDDMIELVDINTRSDRQKQMIQAMRLKTFFTKELPVYLMTLRRGLERMPSPSFRALEVLAVHVAKGEHVALPKDTGYVASRLTKLSEAVAEDINRMAEGVFNSRVQVAIARETETSRAFQT